MSTMENFPTALLAALTTQTERRGGRATRILGPHFRFKNFSASHCGIKTSVTKLCCVTLQKTVVCSVE